MTVRNPIILAIMLMVTAGCSTLMGDQQANTPIDTAQEEELDVLRARVAILEKENARLANRVMVLSREASVPKVTPEIVVAPPEPAQLRETVTTPLVPQSRPALSSVVDASPDAPSIKSTEVPVKPSPRLVQPTFVSTDAVFENEASTIPAASDVFGVHLASYRQLKEAQEGWLKLQRENPDELGLLEARIETVDLPDRGIFLRLIGGALSSEAKAIALCNNIRNRGSYCSVSKFVGERMPLKEAG